MCGRAAQGCPPRSESDDGAKFVDVDVLQSAVGERVLIATGSGAAAWLGMDRMPPIDALIIGSIDDDGKEAS